MIPQLDGVNGPPWDPPVLVPASGDLADVEFTMGADYRLPPLDPALGEAIDEGGTEAIAWYISFHFGRDIWGIYIAEDSVETFTQQAFGQLPKLSDSEKLCLALQTVLDHELFHYWTDVASAQLEFASWQPIYVPYIHAHPDSLDLVCQTEEALANARAWRRLKSPEVRAAWEAAVRLAPPGYRDWNRYRSPRAYVRGKRQLGEDIHAGPPLPPPPPPPPPLLPVLPTDSEEERRAKAKAALHRINEEAAPPTPAPRRWAAAPYEWFFDEHRSGAGPSRVPVRSIPWRRRGRPRPFLMPYARPIVVSESPRFLAALRRLPHDTQQMWAEKTKPALEAGHRSGVDFKKKAGSRDVWRCRVGLHYRAELKHVSGDEYEAQRIGSRESM